MKLALIGCGTIGKTIAKAIAEGVVPASLDVVYDRNKEKAEEVSRLFKRGTRVAEGIEDILGSDVKLVIEAASMRAVKLFAPQILEGGKSIMVMSVGAFLDKDFYREMEKTAEEKGLKIYLPSGAIGSLDSLKSASMARLYEVTLTTAKPPSALKDAPYLVERGIDAREIKEREVLFEGDALKAIEGFPLNVNVAAALSLAGIGAEETKVVVIADPSLDRNIHEISARGDFGEFKFRVENLPSPENPRTSYLAALSAIATLKKIVSPIEVGN